MNILLKLRWNNPIGLTIILKRKCKTVPSSCVLKSHVSSSRKNNKSPARYYCGLPEVGLTTPSSARGGYRYSPNSAQLEQIKAPTTKRGPTGVKTFLKKTHDGAAY